MSGPALGHVLVHVDGGEPGAARVRMAAQVASRLGARLTTLFATTPPAIDLAYTYAAEALPLNLLQDLYLGWRSQAQRQVEQARLPQALWAELAPVPVLAGFAEQARLADLLVLGQHDPADRERRVPADFVACVLAESGRPALVLPYAGRFEAVGRHALVAWKPSPTAARALAGALPLLRQTDRVTVLEWGARESDCRGAALDIGAYLELQGIQAALERQAAEPPEVGELLLSRAADLGADLLVMGCYGHGRMRELVLGGATRTVLQSMTLPVLMCH